MHAPSRRRGSASRLGFALERLEDRRMLAFGITTGTTPTGQQTYVLDNGGDLKVAIIRAGSTSSTIHIGDLSSIQYKNRELLAPYSTTSRYSHYEQGLSAETTITTVIGGPAGSRWIVAACDGTVTGTGAAAVVQYYAVRENDPNLYLASYVPNPSSEGRFIAYLEKSIFTDREAPSDNNGNTGAIEGSDVFGYADGTTTSKFYNVGGRRQIEHDYHGVTGTAAGIPVGAWMFMGSRERSSGGPFFKDIDFQTGSAVEIYNCIFTGHTQTEAYRAGLHTFALQLNGGQAPVEPNYAWLEDVFVPGTSEFFLQGLVPESDRGGIAGVALGIEAGHEITVGLSNAEAQYWDVADASGNYAISNVLPGTYEATLYDGELEVGRRTVTIVAGETTAADITDSYYLPANPIFRIGSFDGTPAGFLNADKIEIMHPSDVRMAAWDALPNYVVGTDTADEFPMAQFMGVNNSRRITFTLSAAQVQDLTFRVGITLGFAGGRPMITVNGGQSSSWTSGYPTASANLNSRGVTRGTWRGPNQIYTFNIPRSAFRVGTNTIDMPIISGSYASGQTWLSPNVVFDAIDLVPTASASPPALASVALLPGNASVRAGETLVMTARAVTANGATPAVNVDWSTTRGGIGPNGGYLAPSTTGAASVRGVATITQTPGYLTGTRTSTAIPDTITASGSTTLTVIPAVPEGTVTVPAGETVTDAVLRTGTVTVIKEGLGTLVLDQANSHSGGTIINAGTAIVRSSGALGTGGLTVKAGATVQLDVGVDAISLPALTLEPGARLDLGYGRITVAAGGLTAAEARALILAGRNNGSWNGPGLMSSVAAADTGRDAVGYRVLPTGGLEIAWAVVGDANLDGLIDAFDLVSTSSGAAFGNGQPAGWSQGDFTYDGAFNAFDLVVMQSTGLYGRGSYRPQAAATLASDSVAASAASTPPVSSVSSDSALVFAALAWGMQEDDA